MKLDQSNLSNLISEEIKGLKNKILQEQARKKKKNKKGEAYGSDTPGKMRASKADPTWTVMQTFLAAKAGRPLAARLTRMVMAYVEDPQSKEQRVKELSRLKLTPEVRKAFADAAGVYVLAKSEKADIDTATIADFKRQRAAMATTVTKAAGGRIQAAHAVLRQEKDILRNVTRDYTKTITELFSTFEEHMDKATGPRGFDWLVGASPENKQKIVRAFTGRVSELAVGAINQITNQLGNIIKQSDLDEADQSQYISNVNARAIAVFMQGPLKNAFREKMKLSGDTDWFGRERDEEGESGGEMKQMQQKQAQLVAEFLNAMDPGRTDTQAILDAGGVPEVVEVMDPVTGESTGKGRASGKFLPGAIGDPKPGTAADLRTLKGMVGTTTAVGRSAESPFGE